MFQHTVPHITLDATYCYSILIQFFIHFAIAIYMQEHMNDQMEENKKAFNALSIPSKTMPSTTRKFCDSSNIKQLTTVISVYS